MKSKKETRIKFFVGDGVGRMPTGMENSINRFMLGLNVQDIKMTAIPSIKGSTQFIVGVVHKD